jgi:hypothetical protein
MRLGRVHAEERLLPATPTGQADLDFQQARRRGPDLWVL